MNEEYRDYLEVAFATNSLTHSERRDLFLEAVEDDELFASLDDMSRMREVMSDRDFRRRLEADSEPNVAFQLGRAYNWATQPKVLLPTSAAVGVLGLGAIGLSFLLGFKVAAGRK